MTEEQPIRRRGRPKKTEAEKAATQAKKAIEKQNRKVELHNARSAAIESLYTSENPQTPPSAPTPKISLSFKDGSRVGGGKPKALNPFEDQAGQELGEGAGLETQQHQLTKSEISSIVSMEAQEDSKLASSSKVHSPAEPKATYEVGEDGIILAKIPGRRGRPRKMTFAELVAQNDLDPEELQRLRHEVELAANGGSAPAYKVNEFEEEFGEQLERDYGRKVNQAFAGQDLDEDFDLGAEPAPRRVGRPKAKKPADAEQLEAALAEQASLEAPAGVASDALDGEAPVKRKRGRPRKVKPEEQAAPSAPNLSQSQQIQAMKNLQDRLNNIDLDDLDDDFDEDDDADDLFANLTEEYAKNFSDEDLVDFGKGNSKDLDDQDDEDMLFDDEEDFDMDDDDDDFDNEIRKSKKKGRKSSVDMFDDDDDYDGSDDYDEDPDYNLDDISGLDKKNSKIENLPQIEVKKVIIPFTESEPEHIESNIDERNYKAASKSLESLGIKAYEYDGDEEYMNPRQLAHIKNILLTQRSLLMKQLEETKEYLSEDNENYADDLDKASVESDCAINLRTRDRERQLTQKIDKALARLENDPDFGYCDKCGDEIKLRRLEARPTAELCTDCKRKAEIHERQQKG